MIVSINFIETVFFTKKLLAKSFEMKTGNKNFSLFPKRITKSDLSVFVNKFDAWKVCDCFSNFNETFFWKKNYSVGQRKLISIFFFQ